MKLYEACSGLLEKPFAQHFIRCSYSGVYVDEYQDCSGLQHHLVSSLARLLPCRLLGDPMQAIFDFAEQPVDWEKDIYPHFEHLGELDTPWRWQLAGAVELGDWLDAARKKLCNGEEISLRGPLPKGLTKWAIDINDFSDPSRLKVFYNHMSCDGSVIAIYAGNQQSKNKSHNLAKSLAGRFSSIEEVEGKAMFSFIKKLEKAKSQKEKLCCVIDFAKMCCNSVDGVLAAATKRGELGKATKSTKYPNLLEAANSCLGNASSEKILQFLCLIKCNPEVSIYRRDLLNRVLNVLKTHLENNHLGLLEAAKRYQQDFRHAGRPIRYTKLIGTTLLVKGLEYQHAIVLEPESLSPKELYVALTRGAKTLSIVTKAEFLNG